VKLKADNQGRIACREFFPPKAAFEVTRQSDGSIRVVELVESKPKSRLVRRKGRTYIETDRPITNEDVAAAMAEFP
jgi:hypothetical protein